MKRSILIVIIIIFTLTKNNNLFGQQDTTLSIKIISVDSSQAFYYYFTFDTISIPEENYILINQLWLDKTDKSTLSRLMKKTKVTIVADAIGPPKSIENGDTIFYRGHGRFKTIFIDGQKIKKNSKRHFDPKNAAIRIDYYSLKKISGQ